MTGPPPRDPLLMGLFALHLKDVLEVVRSDGPAETSSLPTERRTPGRCHQRDLRLQVPW